MTTTSKPVQTAEGYCETYRLGDATYGTNNHDAKCPLHNEAERAAWVAEFGTDYDR